MSSGFFRGTNTEQDSRWGDAEKKLLRRTKFSKVLEQKVNMKKVNMDVMQRWIAQRITSLLGFEDDIVVGTCVNYLSEEGKLDPKKLQLQLTGFLEKSTGMFMEELWGLLVDAQSSLGGIPSAFLQDKKEEMLHAQEEERKQEEELQRRMAEHQQEMEKAALLAQATAAPANGGSSSDVLEALPRLKPTEGRRRASRWGISEAPVAPPAAVEIMTEHSSTPAAADDAESSLVASTFLGGKDVEPLNVEDDSSLQRDSRDGEISRERSLSDRSTSPEKSRTHSRSQRDDEDEESRKEKKRKSRNKHGKKADRKKSRSARKSGEDRRSSKKDGESAATADKSGDEGSSGEDEEGEKSAFDVEEALRLKVVASVASKKGRQTQENRYDS